MTNQEAIRRILDHKRVHSLNEPRAVLINEALDLAIKALEKSPQGEWMRLDLAKRVIAKFYGYLDEDMIYRIQIALEKENEADIKGGADNDVS